MDDMVGLRHAASAVLSQWNDEAFWYRVLEQNILKHAYSGGNNGIDVMNAEWDTLIILDACRYDTFAKNQPEEWPQALPVKSRASNTWNFYERNFPGGHSDTVVVTANPRTNKLRGDAFHKIIPVYETEWDDGQETVTPETMAKATIEAHKEHPDKRILSHWIQPHYPFVGSDLLGSAFDGESVWKGIKRGDHDPEQVRAAYVDCLNHTLPFVDDVLNNDSVSGKVVVSSDHGNVFGERPTGWPLPVYGHPRGILMDELVMVPWMTVDVGDRRTIVSEETNDQPIQANANERLKALGYR